MATLFDRREFLRISASSLAAALFGFPDFSSAEQPGFKSIIVEVKGCGTDRDLAIENARRIAAENARTIVTSTTTVENYKLKNDLIKSLSKAAVTVLDMKDIGVKLDNKYWVKINAEVTYPLDPKFDRIPLKVGIWTDKKEYTLGENYIIFFDSNMNVYAILFESFDEKARMVFPNAYSRVDKSGYPDISFSKGMNSVPDSPYYEFDINNPGDHKILGIFSTIPIPFRNFVNKTINEKKLEDVVGEMTSIGKDKFYSCDVGFKAY